MKALVTVLLALITFAAMARAADAATLTAGTDPHPEGAAVEIQFQKAPTATGSWTSMGTAPGNAAPPSATATIADGATLCVRARAKRIADGLLSSWTPAICETAPTRPDAPTNVKLTVTK